MVSQSDNLNLMNYSYLSIYTNHELQFNAMQLNLTAIFSSFEINIKSSIPNKLYAIIMFINYQIIFIGSFFCQSVANFIRDHPFKTSANFHNFWPLPSAFQQNAYEGDFWSLCTVTFWPSAYHSGIWTENN